MADPNEGLLALLGRGGPAPEPVYTQEQQALGGLFGEAKKEEAGRSLLDYAMNNLHAGEEAPVTPGSWSGPTMTDAANTFIDRQNFPFDPRRLTYDGGGHFMIDNQPGSDFFGGLLNVDINNIPRSLQSFLGPGVSAWYGPAQDLVAKGGAPAWSRFFAPPGNQLSSSSDPLWPGITHYDAWHRSLGEWANLYS